MLVYKFFFGHHRPAAAREVVHRTIIDIKPSPSGVHGGAASTSNNITRVRWINFVFIKSLYINDQASCDAPSRLQTMHSWHSTLVDSRGMLTSAIA